MIYVLCERDKGEAWTRHYSRGRQVKAYLNLAVARRHARGSDILVVDPSNPSASHWLDS